MIPITGPLIRILGDKYLGSVKSAILGALRVMIEKGGVALKPFVPQLQTTFVKCLGDPGAHPCARGPPGRSAGSWRCSPG